MKIKNLLMSATIAAAMVSPDLLAQNGVGPVIPSWGINIPIAKGWSTKGVMIHHNPQSAKGMTFGYARPANSLVKVQLLNPHLAKVTRIETGKTYREPVTPFINNQKKIALAYYAPGGNVYVNQSFIPSTKRGIGHTNTVFFDTKTRLPVGKISGTYRVIR